MTEGADDCMDAGGRTKQDARDGFLDVDADAAPRLQPIAVGGQ